MKKGQRCFEGPAGDARPAPHGQHSAAQEIESEQQQAEPGEPTCTESSATANLTPKDSGNRDGLFNEWCRPLD